MTNLKRIWKYVASGTVAGALAVGLAGTAIAQSWEDDPTLVPMQNNLFLRPQLTVPVGTTVTFVNWDAELHDVIERTAFLFESPLINTGEYWQITFNTEGVYQYVCDLHGNMEGVIVVTAPVAAEPAPAAAPAPADPYGYGY